MLVAVLRAHRTCTCEDEEAFQSFTMELRNFELRDRHGNGVGTATLGTVQPTSSSTRTCFRMNFEVQDRFTILNLRAGIRVQRVSVPFGKRIPTKRKYFRRGAMVTKASIDICPGAIESIRTASCCDSAFEVVGFAIVRANQPGSKAKQAWLTSDFGCRELKRSRPFQFACTAEIECLPECPSDTCRFGSECFSLPVSPGTVNCGPAEEVYTNEKGECACRECSSSQCLDGDTWSCVGLTDFEAGCPPGETIDPDADICTCECVPTEGKCIYNGLCGTDSASVVCPQAQELVVNGEGECICQECTDSQCFVSDIRSCVERNDFANNCSPEEVVEATNTGPNTGECICRKCPNSQCFDLSSEQCAERTVWAADACPPDYGIILEEDDCWCRLCTRAEGLCQENRICNVDVSSVVCPPGQEVIVGERYGFCDCVEVCSGPEC